MEGTFSTDFYMLYKSVIQMCILCIYCFFSIPFLDTCQFCAHHLTMMSEMRVSWNVFGSLDKKRNWKWRLVRGKEIGGKRARGIRGMRYLVCFVRIFVPIYLHIRSPILASPVPGRPALPASLVTGFHF